VGGGVDAAAGATADARPDAVADQVDGGGVADAPVVATEAGPTDLRPVRDTAASDGRFRYPDPAGELCGNSKHTLAKAPAEVLVVLDRSASMDEFTLPPATKWDDATDAVKLVMAANPGIAWGIKLFPTADVECALSPDVEVPIRFGAAASVAAVMDAAGPPMGFLGAGTPTDKAINVAAGYLKTIKSAPPKYIVLVTDGIPSCSDERDPDTTIKAIADAAAAGFQTFVIGIGDDQGADIPTLDKMAVAGGKPRAGMPRFYPAANRTELDAVLETITVSITSLRIPAGCPAARPRIRRGDGRLAADSAGPLSRAGLGLHHERNGGRDLRIGVHRPQKRRRDVGGGPLWLPELIGDIPSGVRFEKGDRTCLSSPARHGCWFR
jgi:hypothetical protein